MRTGPESIKTAMVAGTTSEYSQRGEGGLLLLVHAGGFADWFVTLAASQTLEGFRVIQGSLGPHEARLLVSNGGTA